MNLSPNLNSDVIRAIFGLYGTIPLKKLRLIMLESSLQVVEDIDFTVYIFLLSKPTEFSFLSGFPSVWISSGEVGDKKKEWQ